MTAYFAPTRDMQFVINELAGLSEVAALPVFAAQDIGPELVEAVLEEAAKLAAEVLAPLNHAGDVHGARLSPEGVIPVDGFTEAYRKFIEGGWNGVGCHAKFGGQGLPELINTATQEMWNSANMSFALCPLLNAGAIEAIGRAGSERAAGAVPAENGQRRMDRHHEPDRVAGRLRSIGGADSRGAPRRSLPDLRPEDLHHLGRAQHDREHHSPGAGSYPGRAGGG